jgi:hypothetical protein
MRKEKDALASLVPLFDETGNNAKGSILAVERMSKLLSGRLVLKLERERLEHQRVPLGLKGVEKRGD